MMTFKESTHPRVKELLTVLNHSRRRVRIWYGDTETGRAWNEEFHITGVIGRSTGVSPIPLMIPNRRSIGGTSILDHCIIRIDDINDRKPLYIHPNFHTDLELHGNEVINKVGHQVCARFDSPLKAQNYYEFMEGKRYHK